MPSLPPQAIQALKQGQHIEAIKILRQLEGCDLKTAKDRIDAYLVEHPELERQPIRHQELGWLAIGFLVVAVVVVILLR
jgi:hypothetical protein